MQIAIIGSTEEYYQSIKVLSFKTVKEFDSYVNSTTLRVNVIVITDSALGTKESDYPYNAKALKAALANELLSFNGVAFAVRERYIKAKNFFDFLEEDLKSKGKITSVTVKPRFYPEDMEEVLYSVLPAQIPEEPEYVNIVKKRRYNSIIDPTEIEGLHTAMSSAIVVELNTYNRQIEKNKATFQDIERPVKKDKLEEQKKKLKLKGLLKKSEASNETSDTEPLIKPIQLDAQNLNADDLYPQEPQTDILAVTGITGVTTSAITLFKSASYFGKVLYIDLNYDTLGGSYIINQNKEIFNEDTSVIIKLDDVIASKDLNSLHEQTLIDKKLHALLITSTIKDTMGESVLECLVLQILNAIQYNYNTIILDIPYKHLTTYARLMQKVNYLIHVIPGYKNKYVPAFMQLSQHECVKSFIHEKRIINFRIDQYEVNNLKPTSREVLNSYCKKYLQEVIPTTGIIQFKGYDRSDIFSQVMNLLKEGN